MGADSILIMLEKALDAGLGNIGFLCLFIWVAFIKPIRKTLKSLSEGLTEYIQVQKKSAENMSKLEKCIENLVATIERRNGHDRRSKSLFGRLFS